MIRIMEHHKKIMMSETLRGRLPELESDIADQLHDQYVHVLIDRRIGGKLLPFAGLLTTVLFGANPEIEIKVELIEALETIKANGLTFDRFDLQYGEKVTVAMAGPFKARAARIQDIDPSTQTCVLALQLEYAKKT